MPATAPGVIEASTHETVPLTARIPGRQGILVAGAFCLATLISCTQQQPAPEVSALQASDSVPLTIEPAPQPDTLIGVDRDTLATRLGKPVFLMRATASEIWQYRAQGCVLDLFLYEDAGDLRVTYLEARDLTGNSLSPADCLGAIVAVRQPWPDAAGT